MEIKKNNNKMLRFTLLSVLVSACVCVYICHKFSFSTLVEVAFLVMEFHLVLLF